MVQALVHGVLMDKWLIWRLRWVLLRAAGVALVIKRAMPGVTEGPQGDWVGASLGARERQARLAPIYVGLVVQSRVRYTNE